MATASDQELVDRARAGDRQAFGLFVRRHQPRIYRLAVHLVGSQAEAEDVTQETFVRAYQALDRFEGLSQPYTWLYRIALNVSLSTIRARKVRKHDSDDDPRVEGWLAQHGHNSMRSPADSSEQKQLARTLCEGIDQLSDRLRTTLILVCIDGLELRDAGEVLGCPPGTVAWRVHEARRQLRSYLSDHGFREVAEVQP